MIEVEIIQEDIDNGKRGECELCPISLAVKKIFPNKFVSTALQDVTTFDLNSEDTIDFNSKKEYSLDYTGRLFRARFDSGCLVGPTKIKLIPKV